MHVAAGRSQPPLHREQLHRCYTEIDSTDMALEYRYSGLQLLGVRPQDFLDCVKKCFMALKFHSTDDQRI